MGDLLAILAAGGDVGVWLVVIGFYRMDKRVTALEIWTDLFKRGQIVDTKKAG